MGAQHLPAPSSLDPAMEIALSAALLRRVAAREVPPVVRVYRPAPTLAFGRVDGLAKGFPSAVDEARRRGFEPVLRVVGGRAAAYHPGSVVCEQILAEDRGFGRVEERYDSLVSSLCAVLRDLGADVSVGELGGEYCPGRHSLNIGGRVKVAGIAQRVIRGGSLTSAIIVVREAEQVREVLTAVYDLLGLDFEPATVGALEDVVEGARGKDLLAAVSGALGRLALPDSEFLNAATFGLARRLLPAHVVQAPALGAADRVIG